MSWCSLIVNRKNSPITFEIRCTLSSTHHNGKYIESFTHLFVYIIKVEWTTINSSEHYNVNMLILYQLSFHEKRNLSFHYFARPYAARLFSVQSQNVLRNDGVWNFQRFYMLNLYRYLENSFSVIFFVVDFRVFSCVELAYVQSNCWRFESKLFFDLLRFVLASLKRANIVIFSYDEDDVELGASAEEKSKIDSKVGTTNNDSDKYNEVLRSNAVFQYDYQRFC